MHKKVYFLFLFQISFLVVLGQQNLLEEEVVFAKKATQEQWVNTTLTTLSLEQKIGQMFMLPVQADSTESYYQNIEKLVEKHHVGGIVLLGGGPAGVARLMNRLQAVAEVPLLVGIDAEFGLGKTLDSAITYPPSLALGAVQDHHAVYQLGAEMARQCKILGIHINFSATMHVNSSTSQLEVAYQSFGDDMQKARAKGMAFMQGMEDYGLIACYRHTDKSRIHQRSASTTASQHALSSPKSTDTIPHPYFKYDGQHPLGTLMARLNEPVTDFYQPRPITRSSIPEADMLIDRMALDGIIFSDALSIQENSSEKPGTTELKALLAGNDVLMFPDNVSAAIRKIKKAINENTISEEEINQRVGKILQMKYKAGLDHYSPINIENEPYRQLNRPEALLLKEELYQKGITVVRDQRQLLPVNVLDTATFASLSLSIGDEPFARYFQQMLGQYAPFAHYDLFKQDEQTLDYNVLFERLKRYDYVIIGIHQISKMYEEQSMQMLKNGLTFLKFLQDETNLILVVFDDPYELKHFDDFRHLICAYDEEDVAQRIVPQILFGSIRARGKLPVSASPRLLKNTGVDTEPLNRLRYTLPEAVGLSSDTLRLIDSLANQAIMDEATPGCQVLVARKGAVVFQKSYGHFSYDSLQPVTNETIYDIASVTKVAATLQAVMFLEERGLIDLDEKISAYLPELKGTNKEDLRIREILMHRAGLMSFVPFWAYTRDKEELSTDFYDIYPDEEHPVHVGPGLYGVQTLEDSVWQWMADSKVRKTRRGYSTLRPRHRYRYSDLGFFMLKRTVERITNQSIDEFLEQNFYTPLGLSTLTYLPLCKFPANRISPTAEDDYFRKTLVHGMVHDEGAALMGGVAGHAGLFGNANDLAILMQMNLQDGTYGGQQYFQEGTVARFAKRQFNDNRRGLGWDKPEIKGDGGATAPEASSLTFGHLGFTGTAVWADPQYDLVYIFLSNRIHPNARNTKLLTDGIRTKIHSVVYRAMMDYHTTLVE